ncbi:MAG: hypothetical protein AAFX01_05630 [Cyanobacteria bacterium J06638_28]
MTYMWAMRLAIVSGIFIEDPYQSGGDTVGESLGLVIMVWVPFLFYLVVGPIAGAFAGAQVARFSRWWSPETRGRILKLTLLNAITTIVGSGILTGIMAARNAFPWLQNPIPPNGYYQFAIRIATILGLGLLSINVILPQLVRSIGARR